MENVNETYSVFYSTGNASFFQSKTDFLVFELAEAFINSDLFTKHGFKLDFMLKNGVELMMGKPKDNTAEFFNKAMLFAVEIPFEDYL